MRILSSQEHQVLSGGGGSAILMKQLCGCKRSLLSTYYKGESKGTVLSEEEDVEQ